MAKGGATAALSSPNGHFIKASPVWPLCQEQPNCNFIKAILLSKSNGKFIKDSPKATSSRQPQWLFYQGKWPSHQSQLPLYQSQWPFYQSRLPRQFIKASPRGNFMMVALLRGFDRGRPRLPIYQSQLRPEGPTLIGGSTRYCAA